MKQLYPLAICNVLLHQYHPNSCIPYIIIITFPLKQNPCLATYCHYQQNIIHRKATSTTHGFILDTRYQNIIHSKGTNTNTADGYILYTIIHRKATNHNPIAHHLA